LLEERSKLGVCGCRFREQQPFALLCAALTCHISGDFGCADHLAVVILDWRDRQRNQNRLTIFSHSHGVEMLDSLPHFYSGDNLIFFGNALSGNQQRNVPPNCLLRGVAKESFRTDVPRLDNAIE